MGKMNTTTVTSCPLCGGNLSPADAGTRSQCDNCGAKVNVVTVEPGDPDPMTAEAVIRSALTALLRVPLTFDASERYRYEADATIQEVRIGLGKWLDGHADAEEEMRFDAFARDVKRRAPFGRAWTPSNLRPLFDAGRTVDEVLTMKPEGR